MQQVLNFRFICMRKVKKVAVKLPFELPKQTEIEGNEEHNQVRPKPTPYADRTWMPPRGTRRSFGKR